MFNYADRFGACGPVGCAPQAAYNPYAYGSAPVAQQALYRQQPAMYPQAMAPVAYQAPAAMAGGPMYWDIIGQEPAQDTGVLAGTRRFLNRETMGLQNKWWLSGLLAGTGIYLAYRGGHLGGAPAREREIREGGEAAFAGDFDFFGRDWEDDFGGGSRKRNGKSRNGNGGSRDFFGLF